MYSYCPHHQFFFPGEQNRRPNLPICSSNRSDYQHGRHSALRGRCCHLHRSDDRDEPHNRTGLINLISFLFSSFCSSPGDNHLDHGDSSEHRSSRDPARGPGHPCHGARDRGAAQRGRVHHHVRRLVSSVLLIVLISCC